MDPIEHRRLKCDFAALRFQLALLRFDLIERKYRRDQPRVPAGSAGGGRWTDDDGGLGDAPQLDDAVVHSLREPNQFEQIATRRPLKVDLAAGEKTGGHTFKHLHVGISNADLIRTLSGERVDTYQTSSLQAAHGTFNDEASAN